MAVSTDEDVAYRAWYNLRYASDATLQRSQNGTSPDRFARVIDLSRCIGADMARLVYIIEMRPRRFMLLKECEPFLVKALRYKS